MILWNYTIQFDIILAINMTEDEILYEFVKSGIIEGQFVRQFPIGIRRLRDKYGERVEDDAELRFIKARKYADAICITQTKEEWHIDPSIVTMELRRKIKLEDIARGERGDLIWVFEVKSRLNAEAFGQVLIYHQLFSEDHPQFEVKKGIICKGSDDLIEPVCRNYHVDVFIV